MDRSAQPPETDLEFVDQLRIAVTRLARSQRVVGARMHMEMPFSLMSTLSTVERVGPKTPTELAAIEGVSKPSMTRTLANLEERGYVSRKDDSSDGRQQIIVITRAGRTAVTRTRRHVNAWYLGHLSQLSEADRKALHEASGALLRLSMEEGGWEEARSDTGSS